MAKKLKKAKKLVSPADQAKCSPVNGMVPPIEHRFKPGQSGNPTGRPSAGASMLEWINIFGAGEASESDLKTIADDASLGWVKRTAARLILKALAEQGQDFDRICDRTDGKPVSRSEITGKDGEPLQASFNLGLLSVEELEQVHKTLSKAGGAPL